MSVVVIKPGDGTTDLAAQINAALSDPKVTTVQLSAGLFLVSAPIFIPSGKTLLGAGRDATIVKAASDFVPESATKNGIVNSETGAVGITLSDFSIDASKLAPGGLRLNGAFMIQATDFTITRVDVYNATGYAHFAQGDIDAFNYWINSGSPGTFSKYASGTYEDVRTFNSSVHFEQMVADGVTLTNVHARDGDGDIAAESYFHPVLGSKNITYIDSSAKGMAVAGFDLMSVVSPLENITIINTSVEMFRVGVGAALLAGAYLPTLNLVVEGSTFIAHGAPAARLGGVTGTISNSHFQGETVAVYSLTSGDGTPSALVFTASSALGVRDPDGTAAAYGVMSLAGTLTWDGGTIEGRGPLSYALGSQNISVSATTQLITNGYGALLGYTEDQTAKAIAPSLALPNPGFGSFEGGSLLVRFYSQGTAADFLSVLHVGSEAGQIGVAGDQISFGGLVIGTMSGGAGGAPLLISLTAAATHEAVQALIRAVSFVNDSDAPLKPSRLVEFVATDAAGLTATANAAVILTPVNDSPVLELGAGTETFVENGAAITIAPDAVVSDVDSADFAGGSLKVSFGEAAQPEDQLQIRNDGIAAGQIGVDGANVTYGGVVIGTWSGGTGGEDLVILLNQAATSTAVQALARAVTYASSSDAPPVAPVARFTLDDGDGGDGPGSDTIAIAVEQLEDEALAQDDALTASEDGTTVLNIGANDDPDRTQPQIVEIEGTAVAPGDAVTLASGAKLTVNDDGTVSYDAAGRFETLAAGATASDSFTYKIANGTGATASVTIEGVNDAPVVDVQIANVASDEEAAFTYEVPAGTFSDIDGDGLGYSARLGDGSPLPAWLSFDPATRSFSGTPPKDFTGDVVLTVTASDGGLSASSTFTLTINNIDDPADARADSGATDEDSAVIIDVAANDDVDGPAPLVAKVEGVAVAAGTSVTLASGASVTLNEDGTLSYNPAGAFDALAAGSDGSDSFTYTLENGTSATVTMTIAGVNDAPVAGAPLAEQFSDEESAFSWQVPGDAFSDVDGNALSYSAHLEDGSALPVWLTFDATTRTFSGTPPKDYAGSLSIKLTASDGALAASAVFTLTINNVDDPAVARGDSAATDEDKAVVVAVTANDEDIDGPALLVAEIDGTAVAAGQSVTLKSGATVKLNADGTLSYDPNGAFNALAGPDSGASNVSGSDSFVYRLTGGGTATVVVTVTGRTSAGDRLEGTSGNDIIVGSTHNDLFLLQGGGDDKARGDAGDDDFYFGAAFTAADQVDGGTGRDTVTLQGNYTLAAGSLNLITGAETLQLLSAGDKRFGASGSTAFNYSIATSDANVAAGQTLTISASGLATGEHLVFDGSAEKDGQFAVAAGAGDDRLTGGALNDTLTGGAGNDRLDGGAGRDVMAGGTGDDVFFVDDAWDAVREAAGEGEDIVYSSVSYALGLGVHVETLSARDILLTDRINLTGNELANRIIGNNGDNWLFGGGGADNLVGNGGNDRLDGGTGRDVMAGGLGNDSYYADDAFDQVIEAAGEGFDYVYSSVSYALSVGSHVEVLATTNYLLTTAINLTGNEFNNNIIGNNGDNWLDGAAGDDYLSGLEGNDRLDGGSGRDIMVGGLGNDTYYIDNTFDRAIESIGGGLDYVYASVSYALAAGSEIEILGTTNYLLTSIINLTGNEFNNNVIGNNGANWLSGGAGDDYLIGLQGNDRLDGGVGRDIMVGGTGNDRYYVDDAFDTVIEADGEGSDYVYSSVSYTLGAGVFVELLGTTDSAARTPINLTGNELNNQIVGNAGANWLSGGEGMDYLMGMDGADILDGGAGQDYLLGGAGADIFRFTLASHTAFGLADKIGDFETGADKIDLSAIDANTNTLEDDAFTFIGDAAFSNKAGEIRAQQIGGTFYLYADLNGDGIADMQIVVTTPTLTADDFIL